MTDQKSKHTPESVAAKVVKALLKQPPKNDDRHFDCQKCGEYHLKTHRHHVSD